MINLTVGFFLALLAGSSVYILRQYAIGLYPNFPALLPNFILIAGVHTLCFVFLMTRPRHLMENTFLITLLALSTATAFTVLFSFLFRQTYSLFLLVPFTVFLWGWTLANEQLQKVRLSRLKYVLVDLGEWKEAKFPNIDIRRIAEPEHLNDSEYDVLLLDHQVKQHPEWKVFLSSVASPSKPYVDTRDFYELVSGEIWPKGFFPHDLQDSSSSFYAGVLKRCFDIAVALLALCALFPLFFIVALLVSFSSRGGILFRQNRVGKHGKTFVLYKIRTMYANSEADGPRFTAHKDERVTTIGRYLRRTRLDEWPQFFNVLLGDMSIIGPRPERPEWVEQFQIDIPFYEARHVVRPGITGWAQVTSGYGVGKDGARVKLNLDLYYIRHLGFSIDLIVMYRTLATLVQGTGAR